MKRTRIARGVVALAAVALIAGACSSGAATAEPESMAPESMAPESMAPESMAPESVAPTMWKIGFSNAFGIGNGFREEQLCTAKAQALVSGQVSEGTWIHQDGRHVPAAPADPRPDRG